MDSLTQIQGESLPERETNALVVGLAFVFGTPVPLPCIPGYTVIAQDCEFLQCSDDSGQRFVVQEEETQFILTPCTSEENGPVVAGTPFPVAKGAPGRNPCVQKFMDRDLYAIEGRLFTGELLRRLACAERVGPDLATFTVHRAEEGTFFAERVPITRLRAIELAAAELLAKGTPATPTPEYLALVAAVNGTAQLAQIAGIQEAHVDAAFDASWKRVGERSSAACGFEFPDGSKCADPFGHEGECIPF